MSSFSRLFRLETLHFIELTRLRSLFSNAFFDFFHIRVIRFFAAVFAWNVFRTFSSLLARWCLFAMQFECASQLHRVSTFSEVGLLINFLLILFQLPHFRLELSGLNQFVDIVERGEHGRLLGVGQARTFLEDIITILSVLAVSGGSHVLEKSQNFHIIRRRLSQLVQLSANQNPRQKMKSKNIRRRSPNKQKSSCANGN